MELIGIVKAGQLLATNIDTLSPILFKSFGF